MDIKLISVIIPTYNRAELLRHTLTSLLNQTLDSAKFEVIVVDDGSTDHTDKVVDEFHQKLNIKYFHQEDKGFRAGKARNIGASIAEGEYLVFIDTSVLLASTTLQSHVDRHQLSTQPIAIIGYVYAFGLSNEEAESLLPIMSSNNMDSSINLLKDLGSLDLRESQYQKLGDNISLWPAPFDIFWTCHVSVERNQFISVGMFDETYNSWGGEDVDLGIRLFKAGCQFHMDRDICSFHWPHPTDSNEDKSETTTKLAQELHEKYQLKETSFYGLATDNPSISLNEAISLYGDQTLSLVN